MGSGPFPLPRADFIPQICKSSTIFKISQTIQGKCRDIFSCITTCCPGDHFDIVQESCFKILCKTLFQISQTTGEMPQNCLLYPRVLPGVFLKKNLAKNKLMRNCACTLTGKILHEERPASQNARQSWARDKRQRGPSKT